MRWLLFNDFLFEKSSHRGKSLPFSRALVVVCLALLRLRGSCAFERFFLRLAHWPKYRLLPRQALLVTAEVIMMGWLVRLNIDQEVWVECSTFVLKLFLQCIYFLVHLVVLDAHLLALSLQSLTDNAQVVWKGWHVDLIILRWFADFRRRNCSIPVELVCRILSCWAGILEYLQNGVGVQFTYGLVLVEVVNIKGNPHEPIIILINQLFNQITVLVKVLRDTELGKFLHYALGYLSLETSTNSSTKCHLGHLRPYRLRLAFLYHKHG